VSEKNDPHIHDFRLRRSRQILAIAVSLSLVFSLALLHRTGFLEFISKDTVFAFQILIIASFIGFSSANWRCPSCKGFLGQNIDKNFCRKCRTRLK
jgi:hypothetical protein